MDESSSTKNACHTSTNMDTAPTVRGEGLPMTEPDPISKTISPAAFGIGSGDGSHLFVSREHSTTSMGLVDEGHLRVIARSPRISVVGVTGEPQDVPMDMDTSGDVMEAQADTAVEAEPVLASSKPSALSLAAIKEDRALSPPVSDERVNLSPEMIDDGQNRSILRRHSMFDEPMVYKDPKERRMSAVSFDDNEKVHYVYSSRAYDRSYSKTDDEIAAAFQANKVHRRTFFGGADV